MSFRTFHLWLLCPYSQPVALLGTPAVVCRSCAFDDSIFRCPTSENYTSSGYDRPFWEWGASQDNFAALVICADLDEGPLPPYVSSIKFVGACPNKSRWPAQKADHDLPKDFWMDLIGTSFIVLFINPSLTCAIRRRVARRVHSRPVTCLCPLIMEKAARDDFVAHADTCIDVAVYLVTKLCRVHWTEGCRFGEARSD
ncbi:hypothetical protein BJV78DRAFT_1157207 [Lactifluus subvellereus]|nr:hypothetical protein BJV78DRAFT_1157207 [Lactifluus subvellereus]